MGSFIAFFKGSIGFSTVLLFGSTGETLTEKSGHLNLGIPGIMCFGALGGCFGVSLYSGLVGASSMITIVTILIGVLFSFIFAGLMGLLYGFFTVTLRCNQNVTGLTINIFGVGVTNFFMNKISAISIARGGNHFAHIFSFYDKLGVFGELFLSYGFLTYFAIVLAIVISVILKHTNAGLQLRAVGENPATADAAGINVSKYRYLATFIGSGIAGLGGLFYVFDYLNGNWEYTIDGLGWLSLALVIFTVWKPNIGIIGSIVFGCLYNCATYLPGLPEVKEMFSMAPYLVTIIVLIFTSIFGSKNVQPPASLGLNYFREDR